jgi:hypothetical protein
VLNIVAWEDVINDKIVPVEEFRGVPYVYCRPIRKLVKVGEAKGISDADQEYIKANRDSLIGTVIEVKAQEIIDKTTGSLRHPRFSRWREDKLPQECTWEAHLDADNS